MARSRCRGRLDRCSERGSGYWCRALSSTDRRTDGRHLESVWVDPLHRRSGVLRAILRYLADLEPDVRTWMAWVLDGNDEARAAYERLGFESTGERQPLTDAPRRVEERLRLDCKSALSDSNDPGSAS